MHSPPLPPQETVVFETKWFNIISRRAADSPDPHYVIGSPDFAVVIPLDVNENFLLVRQYRHGVQAHTLEFPSGHVEIGETPEEAARKELLEETGFVAEVFEPLRNFSASTARFSNQVWSYIARNARPQPHAVIEPGLELVIYTRGLRALVEEKEFCNAVHYGAICTAMLNGKLRAS
ncbi:MAG: NUDIX hydrolase [Akkermansiaceae bacterium]|nr:NUDIX hydrolase [Verrucomicrobiales bacterium]